MHYGFATGCVLALLSMQERAFLGVTTLKELVLKRPHGPQGTDDFLQILLEFTLSNIELVCFCFYSGPELMHIFSRPSFYISLKLSISGKGPGTSCGKEVLQKTRTHFKDRGM